MFWPKRTVVRGAARAPSVMNLCRREIVSCERRWSVKAQKTPIIVVSFSRGRFRWRLTPTRAEIDGDDTAHQWDHVHVKRERGQLCLFPSLIIIRTHEGLKIHVYPLGLHTILILIAHVPLL